MDKEWALVTGANSGIGLSTSRKLLESGHAVIGLDHRTDQMEQLRESFPDLTYIKVDLSKPEEVERTCGELFGTPITVIVNNAGYSLRGMVEEVPIKNIRRIFEVNLFSAIRITQACLPEMRKLRKKAIVNVTSIAGKFVFPGNGPYAATKHALEAFTDALRHELGPFGIRVVAVRPAFIATQFNPTAQRMTAEVLSRISDEYAAISKASMESLGRLWQNVTPLKPENVADLIIKAIFEEPYHASYAIGPMASEFLAERAALDDDSWTEVLNHKTGLKGLSL